MATSASLTFPTPLQLKNLADPTSPQDAATKAYADGLKVDSYKISNGTSNVSITTINGNVTTSAGGVDNVLTVTPTGTVVKGSENVTGNLITSGSLLAGFPGSNVFLGNVANIRVYGGASGQFLKLTNAAASTTVSLQVQTNDVTITVASTTGFPTAGYIIIDNEIISYTNVTSTTFTGCVRGQFNSTSAGHATATTVYSYNGGSLEWAPLDATKIINGTSNVSIPTLNGPVTVGVGGTAGIATFNSTGVNIAGYANVNGGTLTTSTPVSFVQTWNSPPTTFTGIVGNIIDNGSTTSSKLIDLKVTSGGTTASKFSVDKGGNLIVGTGSGGTLLGLYGITLNTVTLTGPATGTPNVNAGLGSLGFRALASTYTDGVSAVSSVVADAAIHIIEQPTLAACNSVTFSNASTLYIANAPAAGTNATLTNKYALYIGNGNSYFNGVITSSNQLISTLADGTAPLVVTSKTVVTNLHANLSDYSTVATSSTGTNYLTFVTGSTTGSYQLNSNTALSFNAVTGTLSTTNISASSQLISTLADGTAPLVVTSKTVVTNLHANLSDYSTITTATSGSYYPTLTSSITGAQQEYATNKISIDAGSGNLTTSGSLISTVATSTAPLTVSSTTRVANLNVTYSNVSDFGAVIVSPSTGTFYPVFVNGSTAGNYALQSNTNISFDSANGQLNATKLNAVDLVLSGNLTVSGSTTTINATTTRLVDPIFEMGGGAGGLPLTYADGKDRGLLLHYSTSASGSIAYRVGFNGSSQYVTTLGSANFALPGDFTIEAFVKPTNFTKAGVLFSQGAGTSTFSFGIHTDGKPYISFGILNSPLNTGEGTATTLTAPTGTVITSVLLASWGSPASGTMPNFIAGGTISATTVSVSETIFVGRNNATIAANTYNTNFGDPNPGSALKCYNIVVSYGLFATTALTAGSWSHVAVTRIGSTVTIYINGTAAGSTTYASSIGSSILSNNQFGASYQSIGINTLYYNGSISNFRLTKGQGLYTGTFTSGYQLLGTSTVGSSGPNVVTNFTGTVGVLTFQSSTIVDNSTTPLTLNSVGAPTVDQSGYTVAGGAILADAFIGYKPTAGEFVFANSVSITNEVVAPITYGNIHGGYFVGDGSTLVGVAKPSDILYVGTTSIALNRPSASQTLFGVSVDGTAFTANVAGGVAGGVVYQTGPNVTTSLAAGVNGQVLQSTGSSIQWTNFDRISNSTSNVNVTTANVNTVIGGTVISTVGSTGVTVTGNITANNANITTGTITTSTPIQVTQTWNTGTTAFTGILENITDTASASTSKLIDLQVGGVSKFNVDKSGNAFATNFVGSFANGTSNISIVNNSNISTIVNGQTVVNAGSTGVSITGNATVSTGNLSILSGTLVASNPGLQITQTWNNSSAIFTGIYTNITDTASSASSALIDLQVGGVTKFRVDKAGNISASGFNAPVLISSATTGTAPLSILSTTKVANLNVDLLDGYDSSISTLANTVVVRDLNGNIAGGNISGIISTVSQPLITSVGTLTGVTSTGVVNLTGATQVQLGSINNVKITGGTSGQILSTDGTGGLSWTGFPVSTFYVGTTSLTTNRTSGAQALTGITSIDGSAATLTTPRLINGVAFNGSADITVPLSTTGNITSGNITTTGLANIGTTLTVNGISTLQGVAEVLTSPTFGATTTYNLNTGTIFYHGGGAVTNNFTAAFTNVPAVGAGISRVITATIVIVQGTTAYYPQAVSVNGTNATIKWYGGGATAGGTASAVDYFSFSIFVLNGTVVQVTGTCAGYY